MTDIVTVRLCIRGRVQGVWYRGWMMEQARALGLDGWVRNRFDGSVEAVVSGASYSVDAIVTACRQGPPSAMVDDIDISPAEEPERTGFFRLSSL